MMILSKIDGHSGARPDVPFGIQGNAVLEASSSMSTTSSTPSWRETMPLRIGPLILVIWLAGIHRGVTAVEPPVPGDIVVYHDLSYREGTSRQWKLDLAMKKDMRGRPRPGIVIIHGGGWIEGDKSSFASREHEVPGNIVDFAALGFVAATINYRLSGEAPFPAALEDCKTAVRWLRAHARDYHLDPDHIGAYGNSAGGHLALLLGTGGVDAQQGDGPYQDQSSLVQAVVSDSGPIDLVDQYRRGALRQVCDRLMGGPPEGERAAAYRRASPAGQIHPSIPPLLLIYGVEDAQVPVETADRFVLALGRAGLKDVSYYRLARVDHCPHSIARVPGLRPVVDAFFVRTLMHAETPVGEPTRTQSCIQICGQW
jgi:acetyl esterase/lipase